MYTGLLHQRQQRFAAALVPALVHAAEAHMRQILQPLKVRHRHTARVQQHVRNDDHVVLHQVLMGGGRNWAVGTLANQLRTDLCAVLAGDLALQRSRDQNVAVQFQRLGRVVGDDLHARVLVVVAHEAARRRLEVEQRLDVQAVLVDHRRVAFNDANDLRAVLLKEARGPVADVAEPCLCVPNDFKSFKIT